MTEQVRAKYFPQSCAGGGSGGARQGSVSPTLPAVTAPLTALTARTSSTVLLRQVSIFFIKIFHKNISVSGAGPLEMSILSPPSPVMPGQTVQFLCRAVPVQPRPRALVTLQWVRKKQSIMGGSMHGKNL